MDTTSPVPAYEQIRVQVAAMIDSGVLTTGTRLPPIRQLAADLGLAVNTVARAYRELEGEGLVTSRVRHGTVVAAVPPTPPDRARGQLAKEAHRYAIRARQLGVSPGEAEEMVRTELTAVPPESARGTCRVRVDPG